MSAASVRDKIRERGKKNLPSNTVLVKKLKKQNPRKLDEVIHELHAQTFEKTDCLSCANCCKTTSPIFRDTDIERLSKQLRMRPADFIGKYLRMDEDRDYVLLSSPCPFLDPQNYCMVYESRPGACREYPHTDRKKSIQLLDLGLKNTLVCPAVQEIFDGLQKHF